MEHEVTMLAPPGREQHDHEGQYDVLRPIGSGSFGQVFLVLHRQEQRQYVMKKIAMMATIDEEKRAQTELEVKLLSGMRHPNIVGYRDSFMNDDGHLCILMEYCEHGDVCTYLQQAKKSGNTPDEGRLLEWFIHVILALHALHLKKILHRDLKTQNIFLTGCRAQRIFAAKLGDFGISRVLSSTTDLAKTQIGTPFYMSPELINNKPYSYKSDIWGLGCVLYEIVNGQRAFDAQSLNGLALKIIKGHYTPITSSCSSETKSLIKSMLCKNPSHRPTLKEILHIPHVRRRIPSSTRAVIEAHEPEMRVAVDRAFNGQLEQLGLGAVVSSGGSRPRRDRHKLLRKLEQAELRKKREQESLMRLQKTAALLSQCLDGTPEIQDSQSYVRGYDEAIDFPSRYSHSHEALTAPQMVSNHLATEEHHSPGRRRENRPGPRARTDEPGGTRCDIGDGGRSVSLEWLLDYEHISAHNLENPFQNLRPNVVHSPKHPNNRTFDQDYHPPPPAYGEPVPPQYAAPAGVWGSSWKMSDPRSQPMRPNYGVCLRSLEPQHRSRAHSDPDHSDDSHSSASFSEDGMSDASAAGWGEEQYRHQSLVVQQRIARCQSAINRHEMTIGMLQYTFAQERADAPGTAQPLDLTGDSSDDSIGVVSDEEPVHCRDGRPVAPPIVQDCVARLTRRCLESLGSEKFQAAKMLLQALVDDNPAEVARRRMLELLGLENIGFYSLIDQIVYMERKWGTQEPT
jgi:serine/threonine protein kinase